MLAFGFEGEVDHHDAVFLDDADQQDDADDGDDAELLAKENQRQKSADAGGRQRGKNGDGMDEAFVQDAEDDVDGDERGQDQQRHVRRAN